jgi:hypothetical protein
MNNLPGEQLMPLRQIAQEARMNNKSIHRDLFVQKAGQAAGAALPWSLFREGTTSVVPFRRRSQGALAPEGGSDRVAGGTITSVKTSTAALASSRRDLIHDQRRAPRHSNFHGNKFIDKESK